MIERAFLGIHGVKGARELSQPGAQVLDGERAVEARPSLALGVRVAAERPERGDPGVRSVEIRTADDVDGVRSPGDGVERP